MSTVDPSKGPIGQGPKDTPAEPKKVKKEGQGTISRIFGTIRGLFKDSKASDTTSAEVDRGKIGPSFEENKENISPFVIGKGRTRPTVQGVFPAEPKEEKTLKSLEAEKVISLINKIEKEGGLEIEGIFRLSGEIESINELTKGLLTSNLGELKEQDIHVYAGALKKIIREKAPLERIRGSFLNVEKNENEFIEAWKSLDKENKVIVKSTFDLLRKIADQSDTNKMTESNLAIVIGPNIVKPDPQNPFSMQSNNTVRYLITNWNTIKDKLE